MDNLYDMPIPEPPVPPEVNPAAPIPPVGIPADPLGQILDRLEMSIEQNVPVPEPYADSLCRTLDELEASVIRHGSTREPSPEPLHETLGRLENEIEQQTQAAPESKDILLENANTFRQKDFSDASNKTTWPIHEPLQKTDGFSRMPSAKPYPEQSRRRSGHSTGIRNRGRDTIWYCNLYQEWVSADECDACGDFETADFATDDEGNKRCRHSVPTDSNKQDENTDSEEPIDE